VKDIFLYEHTMKGDSDIDPELVKKIEANQTQKRQQEPKVSEKAQLIELSEEELFRKLKKVEPAELREHKDRIVEGLLERRKFERLFRIWEELSNIVTLVLISFELLYWGLRNAMHDHL